jgi:hypothetical protein
VDNGAFTNKSARNRGSDAPSGTKHGNILTGEVHLHNRWVVVSDRF